MQTSRLLDETAEKIGRMLEREGFLSLPVSADKPVEIVKINPETGKRFRQTRTLGFLSHKHSAVSCGMGEIGKRLQPRITIGVPEGARTCRMGKTLISASPDRAHIRCNR